MGTVTRIRSNVVKPRYRWRARKGAWELWEYGMNQRGEMYSFLRYLP